MIRDRQTRCKGGSARKQRISWGFSESLDSSRPVVRKRPHSAILANKRRMSDLQQQLAVLRQRIAGIQARDGRDEIAPRPEPRRHQAEDFLTGEEIETAYGTHFETEKLYERHRRHGSADIGSLAELPRDLLGAISNRSVPDADPHEWAFPD